MFNNKEIGKIQGAREREMGLMRDEDESKFIMYTLVFVCLVAVLRYSACNSTDNRRRHKWCMYIMIIMIFSFIVDGTLSFYAGTETSSANDKTMLRKSGLTNKN